MGDCGEVFGDSAEQAIVPSRRILAIVLWTAFGSTMLPLAAAD